MDKMFVCQQCDQDIEVADVYNTDSVICHQCGEQYTLRYMEREEAWELIPVEPVEEERLPPEVETEEPFEILDEPAAPRKNDYDRY